MSPAAKSLQAAALEARTRLSRAESWDPDRATGDAVQAREDVDWILSEFPGNRQAGAIRQRLQAYAETSSSQQDQARSILLAARGMLPRGGRPRGSWVPVAEKVSEYTALVPQGGAAAREFAACVFFNASCELTESDCDQALIWAARAAEQMGDALVSQSGPNRILARQWSRNLQDAVDNAAGCSTAFVGATCKASTQRQCRLAEGF
jgi:hypothetical protein